MGFFGSGKPRILLANVRFCRNQISTSHSSQNPIPCVKSKYRAGGLLTGHVTYLLTVRVFKNAQIGAVLERLLCKLNCIGSGSSTNFMNFRENCNAQGQAVGDFSDSADSVYCSQTFVFAKTAVLPIRATRILYPAYRERLRPTLTPYPI